MERPKRKRGVVKALLVCVSCEENSHLAMGETEKTQNRCVMTDKREQFLSSDICGLGTPSLGTGCGIFFVELENYPGLLLFVC